MSQIITNALAAKGATITLTAIPSRTDGADWHDAAHYVFTLIIGKRALSGNYSQGWGNYVEHAKKQTFTGLYFDKPMILDILSGRKKLFDPNNPKFAEIKAKLARTHKPTLLDVFGSLLSDANGSDTPFEQWADDLGYGTDSIKGKRAWEACNDTRRFLETVFSRDEMAALYEAVTEL